MILIDKIEIVTIKDIREALFDSYLDTEYREALAHSIMVLGYVNKSPMNLYFGTPEQQKEALDIINQYVETIDNNEQEEEEEFE